MIGIDRHLGVCQEHLQLGSSFRKLERHIRTITDLPTRCLAPLTNELRRLAEALEHERDVLMPVPQAFDGYVESLGPVSSTALVSVDRNRYSVPCEWVGQWASVRLYPTRVEVVIEQERIASHVRLTDRGETCYDWRHYIPLAERKPGVLRNGAPFLQMPAPLRALQRTLLRRDGGDRVMSQVLSAVSRHGLEAVLVAVELVLQSGTVTAEHVLNVLGRLAPDAPRVTIETALALAEPPRADTARYDVLRAGEVDHV